MEAQELIKTIENLQSNASASLILIFYYLIVYWTRIKDGLGLSINRQANLDKIEKNYHLLKLRIELEKIKKESGLDSKTLEKLEQEMQARLTIKKNKPFTAAQKFIAIPLIIAILIIGFLDIQNLGKDPTNSVVNIISGATFVITIIMVGFWGIPLLQKQKHTWFRKSGFIIFWTFAFHIVGYFSTYLYANIFFNNTQFSEDSVAYIFLIALLSSIILGLLNKLPFMHLSEKNLYR